LTTIATGAAATDVAIDSAASLIISGRYRTAIAS
jgi:hypothetical protein